MKNLNAYKLDLIASLINLEDEAVLNELASVIEKHYQNNGSIQKLSEEDLVERALKSNNDYKTGKYFPQEQVELDSEKW